MKIEFPFIRFEDFASRKMTTKSGSDSDAFQELNDDKDEIDDAEHSKFLDAINAISRSGKKKKRAYTRSEVVRDVSEYNISTPAGSNETVALAGLIGSLGKTATHGALRRQLRLIRKKHDKILDTPLPRPQAERAQRVLAYEQTSKHLRRWDPIVQENRLAEQLVFPLEKPAIVMKSSQDFVSRFKPRTPLELEVAKLLHGSDSVLTDESTLTPAEEKVLMAMSLREATERRKELQKMRALLSYKEAKLRRQAKIKSKKYRRIMRKARIREENKIIEKLQEEGVDEADDQLKELEKSRAEERMSLRHRGTGKWAKQQAHFGKHDPGSKQALLDQLEKSRQLTQKPVVYSDSDSEVESDPSQEIPQQQEKKIMDPFAEYKDNPWMLSAAANVVSPSLNNNTTQKEGKSLPSFADKNTTQKEGKLLPSFADKKLSNNSRSYNDVEKESPLISETTIRKRTLEDFDDDDDEEEQVEEKSQDKRFVDIGGRESRELPQNKPADREDVSIDPNKFVTIETKDLRSGTPDLMTGDSGDDEDEQRMTIAEAFEDDDVVAEFSKEKKEIVEKEKPKDIDLTLPGWGSWGGTGVKPSKRKRKRFIIKAPPGNERKDKQMEHVIISEQKNTSIHKHKVNEVPFPFANSEQFENTVRAPIGRTWNTETSFNNLTAPSVVTAAGAIIDPIDAEETFKNKTEKKNVRNKKFNKKKQKQERFKRK